MQPASMVSFLNLITLIAALLPLSSFGQQCIATSTPTDLLGPFYVANSEMSSLIAPDGALMDPNQRLFVYGKVLKTGTCEGIPNIVVEAWYAGPPDAENDYYQTNEYRGQVKTNAIGEYNFTQKFPSCILIVPSYTIIFVYQPRQDRSCW
jgi:protocatechuate 3,4-dioxygenase beta subunit